MIEGVARQADALGPDPAQSLLVEMLGRVRHSQDTPLYFGIDGHRIARAALARVVAGLAEDDSTLASAPHVMARIEELIRAALEVPACEGQGHQPNPTSETLQSQLGEWMLATHQRMRLIHPMALDILGLRVAGESTRVIAEQLDFGLRLTRRILADMRAAW